MIKLDGNFVELRVLLLRSVSFAQLVLREGMSNEIGPGGELD